VNLFTYTAFLPSLKKSVRLKELPFSEFKQLCKLIANKNDQHITDAFDNLVNELCLDDLTDITFLDKLIILLTVRAMCIKTQLELTIKHPETDKPYNLTFKIYDIIEKIDSADMFNKYGRKEVQYNNIKIVYGIPSQFYFKTESEKISSLIKHIYINGVDCVDNIDQIIDRLPAIVYKDAKEHLQNIQDEISKLSLLSVQFNNIEEKIEITPNLFNKSTLDFLKLCYERDLISLYEMEYILCTRIELPVEIVRSSTLSELQLYINIYEEEQAARSRSEQKAPSSNPLAGPR